MKKTKPKTGKNKLPSVLKMITGNIRNTLLAFFLLFSLSPIAMLFIVGYLTGPPGGPSTGLAIACVALAAVAAALAAACSKALSDRYNTQINEIRMLARKLESGDFSARINVVREDELGEVAGAINNMLEQTVPLIQSSEERDAIQNSVMKLLTEISDLADGDLTIRAEVTEDITGAIADSFNSMAEQLSLVVRNVKDATLMVSNTSGEVTISTEHLAEISEMQAAHISEAIEAVNEMAGSIRQVAQNAALSAKVSRKSTQNAKEGAEAVSNTNGAMRHIRDNVQETARAVKRLGESSQEIGAIVQLINDIADRTSILSLNASIQAAMAGEAGRGFAVVAEEVQRLAERSANATKKIDTLIKNIQGEINEAGISMQESIRRVVEGSRLADDAHRKLEEIESVSARLADLIESISVASVGQAKASQSILGTMEEVGEISSQTSTASRQTAMAMQNLSKTSDQLRVSVSAFRLREEKMFTPEVKAA